MDGWTGGMMDGCTVSGQVGEWRDGRTDRCTNGQTGAGSSIRQAPTVAAVG